MMIDKYIQQYLATPASSCLTNQELASIDVSNLALNLHSLLIKPGYEFLRNLTDLHTYFAWSKGLILNCCDLSVSNSGKFHITSEVNGSKCVLTTQQIAELIRHLQADLVLLPSGIANNFVPSSKYFLSHNEHQSGFGVYFKVTDANFTEMLPKINEFSEVPKYIYADLSLDLYLQLLNLPDTRIENIKFAADAFHGRVYRADKQQSILDDACEHEFVKLVADCSCYTCSSGYTVAYLHHLFKHTPLLCQRLLILHNVFYASHLPSR